MIRPAELTDLPWIDALWEAWWKEAPVPFTDKAQMMYLQRELFRGIVEGSRLGVALVEPERAVLLWAGIDADLHGFGIYVRREDRGGGTGTALLQRGLAWAKENGYRRVLLSPYVTNPRAMTWLRGAGFRPAQIVMTKEL